MPIKYTIAQLRESVGLSKETFRHWRTVIPFLEELQGRSAQVLPEHFVATAILNEISGQSGIKIGSLSVMSGTIFSICREMPWTTLESGWLLIEPESHRCEFVNEVDLHQIRNVVLICPLLSTIRRLKGMLAVNTIAGPQEFLPLVHAPAAVTP